MNPIKVYIVAFFTLAILFVAFGGANAMNIFKNDFEQKWDQLSQDVKKLNEYTALHPVELRDVKVDDRNLDGAIFTGAKFSGVEWEDTTSQKSTFTKVVFHKCKFIKANFSYSTFTDVLFKDCEFVDADIDRSKFANVRFEGCKFQQMGLVDNVGDTLVLVNCHLLDSGMGDCAIDFEIKDCTLDGVDVSTSKGSRKVLIEGGLLSEVDFGDSHFSTVTLRRVKQGEGPVKLNDITAEKVVFDHVNLTKGTAIARSEVKSVSIEGGDVGTSFGKSTIGSVYIRDANLYYMEFSRVSLPKVTIANCKLYDTGFYDGYIDELTVQNSEFDIIAGKNFKADTVVWHNVTLDGKIDFTNAQIKDFRPTDIKRGPNLQLITTGSNIRF